MKPQDAKNQDAKNIDVDSTSQRQEEAVSNESFASSLAHLEMTSSQSAALPPISSLPLSPTKLQDLITSLEKDLSSGYWLLADYEDTDFTMMLALVKQANRKYPDLHLKFTLTAHDFTLSLKEALANGIQSSRYIINTQERGNHFAVIDHRTIENKTSVILFESTTFMNNTSATLLALRTRQALHRELPECHFSIAEMDIQRSSSECGIFSLALAKKLHIEAHKLARIHQDNINGVLCEPNTPLPSEKLDTYLPVSFYKHTQGRRRLEQYIKSNPGTENEKVNKKGETLYERFEKNLTSPENKTLSISAHSKRISEYKSALHL
ncbi:YopJ/AvrA family T3SS effector serine/threonine acetyltransferase [Bartonella machadoae]|uniref:YopJ/AvrA family T3SS effector serine/threonine acetyltransferase n=1 Tax=Bartonella machadoae TaxID=2893471 RepID=UPI0027E2AFEE|nr:YopJ/AvrA family T3SS effector serine/threonine acetyltransferase [Bartonella machadoae]UNE53961.1 YopJ family type III secretion system effector serine/threonine acetyltransferase [Bartonella machadoae]